jgi:hypothetical protein
MSAYGTLSNGMFKAAKEACEASRSGDGDVVVPPAESEGKGDARRRRGESSFSRQPHITRSILRRSTSRPFPFCFNISIYTIRRLLRPSAIAITLLADIRLAYSSHLFMVLLFACDIAVCTSRILTKFRVLSVKMPRRRAESTIIIPSQSSGRTAESCAHHFAGT